MDGGDQKIASKYGENRQACFAKQNQACQKHEDNGTPGNCFANNSCVARYEQFGCRIQNPSTVQRINRKQVIGTL